ncbi:hypothetical protein C8R48DRAFT_779222 [Suillus tomentosus]|nr:hypothetical protein C8R48DRAFT_779222 [Suillus tomentosus]
MKISCAIDGVGVRQSPRNPGLISKKPVTRVSRSQRSIAKREEKKPDVLPGRAQMQPEHVQLPLPDLGRRLDLLAANERVDALEVRVGSVETNVLKRLDELEQRLNASDARWRSLETLG